jgi:drug/metabolite transporter (DMT)-like permease
MPLKKELIGVALAILGCVFMIMDPQAARKDSPGSAVLPAVVDIGSAFFGALYFIFSADNAKNVPICLLLLIYNSHIFILNSGIAKLQNHEV